MLLVSMQVGDLFLESSAPLQIGNLRCTQLPTDKNSPSQNIFISIYIESQTLVTISYILLFQ